METSPTAEYDRRMGDVEAAMAAHQIDCLLLNRSTTIKYLTGVSSTCSWLLLSREGRRVALVLEPEYVEYRKASVLSDVRSHRAYYPETMFQALSHEFGLRARSLAAETDNLKANQYRMIERCFGDALNPDECADRIVEEARMVKTPAELEKVRRASELVSLGMRAAREELAIGMTERELSQRVVAAMRRAGGDSGAYLYVASGHRSGMVHVSPTDKVIDGGPIAVDIHASYQGYFSDMARTFFLADGAAEQREAYAYLRKIVTSTIDAVRPGTDLVRLRQLFHQSLVQQADWIPMTGMVLHGIGVKRPEEPRFYFPHTTAVAYGGEMKTNMTLSCSNVSLYSRQGWGVKYEDTFLVTDDRPEVLTREE